MKILWVFKLEKKKSTKKLEIVKEKIVFVHTTQTQTSNKWQLIIIQHFSTRFKHQESILI